ncbi:pilus assembly FimT family protein [Bacillus solimangrovi]|uniref:Prepilin-type N-terminal cleavage/methylation domain-containing protein n=1 Tax=Bacillus solimangrovi TaxID=1305675 RepID=A0A1E5LBI8_9BACI|nr:type II secretion system protein [Bacillus solimangrovi]OEH91455.1 hypothetical protein BFG57_04895 [Bacillus solimangrovi]
MLKRFIRNEKGLTLVELLAVIVILGIIAAIAVPSIGGIIEKTKKDAQVAEAIQIINAAKLHASTRNVTTGDVVVDDSVLGEYLDNIDDPDYEVYIKFVTGTGMEYYIRNHKANSVVVGTNDPGEADENGDYTSETQLINY